jgi:hypothetical protein
MLTTLGIFAAGVFTAILSTLLADEFADWTPRIVQNLIRLSVARLSNTQRERFQEEWESHVNDVPGKFGKLLCAAGFLVAAYKIAPLGKWSLVRRQTKAVPSNYALLAPIEGLKVIRCNHCLLVQFCTTNDICRRCHARF